jgi:mycofactocin precursor peptide peptidase
MNNYTTFDIAPGSRILILPLGSWEQHGPHLPLQTDSLIIEAVVNNALSRLYAQCDEFLVAPTLSITASDEHEGFAGGLSCGTEALVASVVSIARSATWARGVCIANGHGGNSDALRLISSALEYEEIPAAVWSLPAYKGGDMHAGHTETSLLLHLHPERVRREQLEAGAIAINQESVDEMRKSGVRAVSSNGVLGDPRTATAEHGIEVLNLYTHSLVASLKHCVELWPVRSQ